MAERELQIPEESTLLAGAAKAEITPSSDLFPLPLIAIIHFNKVFHPIYVRALSLSNGTDESLFIALEMTLVPFAEETMEFLTKSTGLPKESIFVTATHTHAAPPVSLVEHKGKMAERVRRWYEQVKDAMLSAVREARSRRVPVRYGYGEGKSYVNVNRDLDLGKKSVLGNNYERPSDKTIRMIRFEDMEGRPVALIVNYACHAVVLNGYLQGLSCGISGDLPGRTCAKLEHKLEDAVVLWCSGAAGDQNPRIMAQQYVKTDRRGKPQRVNLRSASMVVLEYLSDEHARDIMRANRAIVCTENNPRLGGMEKVVPVKAEKREIPYILRVWMLGDIAFEGVSAEIVTSIGKALREASPFEHTILVSHTTAYHGYCADDWEVEHDAFEAGLTKSCKGEAQKAFTAAFRDLFQTV